MRNIIVQKYNEVCAHLFEYIEAHMVYTQEEKEELEKKPGTRKVDTNQKPEFIIKPAERDIKFGLWGNISGKAVHHKKIDFNIAQCTIPRQNASHQVILRGLWTSNDY